MSEHIKGDNLCNLVNQLMRLRNEVSYQIDRHLITNSNSAKLDEIGLLIEILTDIDNYHESIGLSKMPLRYERKVK